MRFKVDENLPREATDLLRNAGHDALSVLDQCLGGTPDPGLYAICQQENRVLMTLGVFDAKALSADSNFDFKSFLE